MTESSKVQSRRLTTYLTPAEMERVKDEAAAQRRRAGEMAAAIVVRAIESRLAQREWRRE